MNKTIGRNLSLMRKLNPFSLEDVACYLGLSVGEYQQLEDGNLTPSTSMLEKAAGLLGFEEFHFFDSNECSLETSMLACAFDGDKISYEDMVTIANFKRSFMNYLKVQSLIQK